MDSFLSCPLNKKTFTDPVYYHGVTYERKKLFEKFKDINPDDPDIIPNLAIKNIIEEKFKIRDNILKHVICPISFSIMTDPVITSNGISYDKSSLDRWYSVNKRKINPVTREKEHDEHCHNFILKNFIETYFLYDIVSSLQLRGSVDLEKEPWMISYFPTYIYFSSYLIENPNLIKYITDEQEPSLKKGIVKMVIHHDYKLLKYIRNQSYELCMEAIRKDYRALEYVNEQTEKICKAAIIKNYRAVRLMRIDYKYGWVITVKSQYCPINIIEKIIDKYDTKFIKTLIYLWLSSTTQRRAEDIYCYIDRYIDDEKFLKKLVTVNNKLLNYKSLPYSIKKWSIKRDFRNIAHIKKGDPNIELLQKIAIRNNWKALKLIDEQTTEIILYAFERNIKSVKYIKEYCRKSVLLLNFIACNYRCYRYLVIFFNRICTDMTNEYFYRKALTVDSRLVRYHQLTKKICKYKYLQIKVNGLTRR
jgi:hypothetical protein